MNKWKKISDFAMIRRGASPRPIGDPKYFGGTVGWIRISDVTKSRKFLKKTTQYVSVLGESLSVRVDKGDLIMSICGTIGKPVIIDFPSCIHDGFVQFYNLQDVNKEYLYYQLQFHEENLKSKGQPGTQVNLNTTIVGDFQIYFPEKKVQNQIAKILGTIDKVIEKTEAAIAKYEAIKQGMMQDLFSRGIGEDGQLRPTYQEAPHLYKKTELGFIPKEWNIKNIIDVSQNGLKNGYFKKPELVGKGLKLINVTDIYQSFGIDTNHKKVERVEVPLQDYKKYKAIKGDLFFTRSSLVLSGIAKCNILREEKEPTVFECHVMMLRPNPQIVYSDYLALYCLTSTARNLLMGYAKQVAMTTISQDDMSKLSVIVPSIKEQVKIARKIIKVEDIIKKEKSELIKQTQLKKGLMQDLLTGKVAVKI